MTEGRPAWTYVTALAFLVVGVAAGAGGAAWSARDERAAPWRRLRVEQAGLQGEPSRTRVVFENPKLPLQAIEVIRLADGRVELARVALQGGEELVVRYEGGGRPSVIEAADGSRATLAYSSTKAEVAFIAPDGRPAGDRQVLVPLELRGALRLAGAEDGRTSWLGDAARRALSIREALAAPDADPDERVTVRRDVEVQLDVAVVDAQGGAPGKIEIEAGCAPLTCLPQRPDATAPGRVPVVVGVTGSVRRADIVPPSGSKELEPFRDYAREERVVAKGMLRDVEAVVAAMGLVASGCRSAEIESPVCVAALRKDGTSAAGAVHALAWHEVDSKGAIVEDRATELYYEVQARGALDRPARVEVCVSREGYARACAVVEGRPFGADPLRAERKVELRRGIGGDLAGSFAMTQSDGSDCKFSPSPKTSGALRLSFDNDKGVVTASMKTNERGTRANLGCSLGTANMSWAQNYSVTASQSFTKGELLQGGKLPLQLSGTMSGTASFSFSNCRSSGGVSANCPAGKNEGYTYDVQVVGEIDLDAQTGSGRIVVQKAPLVTAGTWRVPAERAP